MTPESARTREELVGALHGSGRVHYLLFWGHTPGRDGEFGKGCLSQWFPAGFTIDGATYPTAEHFMMAAKARLFGDSDMVARVLASATPQQAKALGRQVAGFVEAIWLEHRFALVVEGNLAKFGQNPDLKKFLLATRDSVLVEASPVDRIWSIGLAADDPRAQDPARWRGENLLGFALMEVRARLRDER